MVTLRSRFTVPLVLLSLGVLLSGYVFWRMVNRSGTERDSPDSGQKASEEVVAPDSCGDGICQNIACLSTNCPKPETIENCPEDCAEESAAGNDPGAEEDASNVNSEAAATALNFSLQEQTLDEKQACPIEESNLTPSDAVAIAQDAGLAQGTENLTVRLYKYALPLDECVWSVKNFATKDSGKDFLIIDLSQEVFQNNSWKSPK